MVDLNFGNTRGVPLIRQAEASECGLACLAMVANYHGMQTDLIALRRRYQTSLKGATLKQLLSIAEDLGFSGRPLRGEVDDLAQAALPLIIHWDLNHYVVLTRISRRPRMTRYHVQDPAGGSRLLTRREMNDHFTGVMLELVKSAAFRPQIQRTSLRFNQLWERIDGFWSSFFSIIALSVILQIATLVTPFFLQISIDTVLPSADADLLIILAWGFGGVAAISALTAWLRSLVLLRMTSSLSYQVTVNLFRQMLRLPLSWFENRYVGDVVSRFGSTKPISDVISQGLVSSLIDGVLAIVTIALVLVYSPLIAAISLAALATMAALRFGFFESLKLANISVIAMNARESSSLLETIRGMATIKSFGEEANRQRLWQAKKADAVNAEIRSGKLNAGFSAAESFILAAERVIFVYIAIRFAINGKLSVGMVFALESYRQQFLDAMARLIQQLISYRMLDMHLARVSDIALAPVEQTPPSVTRGLYPVNSAPAEIELRNVWFRYAFDEPDVIRGVSLKVSPGEMIALVGSSGGGKTTLIKIMMGLLPPTMGEVLIDGQPLAKYGLSRWRREISSVAQDDAMFAGSLADNISFFDPEPDHDRIIASTKAANMHDDVELMPMQYQTTVGDMGSVLSGGQKQRIMLARALYRGPRSLMLDEATAHLDPRCEAEVGAAVRALSCTRVIIAHRPQTIERADRLFALVGGSLVAVELRRSDGTAMQRASHGQEVADERT